MKTLFIGIIFTLLSAMSGMAHPYPWLKAPDTIPLFKEKPAVVQGWDSLLKEGKLTEFYTALGKTDILVGSIWEKGVFSPAEMNQLLWIFYYAAKAPLFPPIGYSDAHMSVGCNNLDFSRKKKVASSIARQCRVLPASAAGCGVKKKQLAELMALYVAAINRAIYDVYDPDLRRKQEELAVEYDRIYQKRQERWFVDNPDASGFGMEEIDRPWNYFRAHLIDNESRNMSAQASLDHFLADQLMTTLLLCFPGDKAAVEKYLKLAGYQGEAMDDLIDRTVGREAHTEFLYKGDRGRRHERKLKTPPPPAPEPRKPVRTPLLF